MNYNFFRQKCREKGYSPSQFVEEKLGLSRSNITNWQHGENPSYDVLIKMSRLLECSLYNLLFVDVTSNENNFWETFCKLADERGIKPHKALRDMNISSGSADNWKCGSIPSGKILIKIAKYFNASIDSMLGLNFIDTTL